MIKGDIIKKEFNSLRCMEPNNNNPNSTLETLLDGFRDGIAISADPLGVMYSGLTGSKTIGYAGFKGVDEFGNKNPKVDYNSLSYKSTKFVGLVIAGIAQVKLYGIPQAVLVVGNYYGAYKRGKRKD